MRQRILRSLVYAPSIWCIRLLCVLSLIVTCVLAFSHSPRAGLAAIISVLLLLLSAVNRLRIHNRIKRLSATARRPKRERGKHADE